MADTKITALTSISTSTDPINDVFPIVDISDTTMAATGTTKKVTTNQLLGAGGNASLGTLATSGASTLGAAVTVTTGDISASNGRLKSSGASAGLRITSSTGDMYQTVASRTTAVSVTSVTVVFTVSNTSVNCVIVDAQLFGFQSVADFCLGKYGNTTSQDVRSSASAGITATLLLDATQTIHTFTITIGSPITSLGLPILNLKVSVGGGLSVSPTFLTLPVITFLP
jgi:hypothetical protein